MSIDRTHHPLAKEARRRRENVADDLFDISAQVSSSSMSSAPISAAPQSSLSDTAAGNEFSTVAAIASLLNAAQTGISSPFISAQGNAQLAGITASVNGDGPTPSARPDATARTSKSGSSLERETVPPDGKAFNDAVRKFQEALTHLPTVAVVRF